jgi:hypothetical protein
MTKAYDTPTISFGTYKFNRVGNNDFYIVSYNTDGNLRWAKSVGGNLNQAPTSIELDSSGDIYISGNFNSANIIFDSISLPLFYNAWYQDAFIARLEGGCKPARITYSSPNKTKCLRDSVVFSVIAEGDNCSYQWWKDGKILTDASGSIYRIDSTAQQDEGIYKCVVTNKCGSKSASSSLQMLSPPVINIVPEIKNKNEGDSVKYCLSPSGGGPFLFRWLKDGSNIDGETGNCLSINPLKTTDSGIYSCIIENQCGQTTTAVATLNVSGSYIIDGYLTYDNKNNTIMSGDWIYLMNEVGNKIDSAKTQRTGYYKFSNVNNGKYFLGHNIEKQWGGGDPLDALTINRYYIKNYTFPNLLRERAADVTADGKVFPNDALLINRRFVNLIQSFKSGNWLIETVQITVNNANVSLDLKALCFGDVNGSFVPK